MTVAFAAEGQTGDPELSPVYDVRHYGRTGRVSDRRVRYRGPGTDTEVGYHGIPSSANTPRSVRPAQRRI